MNQPHTHVANPVLVRALAITSVSLYQNDTPPHATVLLADGTDYSCDAGMLARYEPVPGDYLVTQEDGYVYLNPKAVFERKYRVAPLNSALSFGAALERLKEGNRIARLGWNGKGMWLAYSPGAKQLDAGKFWAGQNRTYAEQCGGGVADVLPCITMKTATGEILMGWLASQSDMLADDWLVLTA